MRGRGLLLAWLGIALVLLLALFYEVGKWRSLQTEGARAAANRARLTKEIKLKEDQIVQEMRANAGLLQEMQWTSAGGDPSAFLTRLADLVQEKRMRITSISALERSATAQFSKTWHTVTVVAPYREVREVATRIEQEKGILEDVLLELPKDQPVPGGRVPEEIQARFKMTALELTPEAKRVFDRSLAASGSAAPAESPAAPALALPVPAKPAEAVVAMRDPFAFGALPRPKAIARASGGPRAGGAGAPATASAGGGATQPVKAEVPMEVKGIVSFPGGYLAIVNNQIVKVGDTVTGHRVERITDNSVVLRDPEGKPRTVPLPDLISGVPSGPRR